jgi:hypothetical protein
MIVTDLAKFLIICIFISAVVGGCDEYYRKLELQDPATQMIFYEKEFYG